MATEPLGYADAMAGRAACVARIADAAKNGGAVVVRGGRDAAARCAIVSTLNDASDAIVWNTEGDGHLHGYLGGFEPLLLDLVSETLGRCPELVSRHEQSLKRIWPQRDCTAFRVPRDLTNTASRAERTRFYHHEYQNKLLVGLAEFALEALLAVDRRIVLVITDADRLSPTSRSLLDIFCRLRAARDRISFVLLDQSGTMDLERAQVLQLPPLSRAQFEASTELDGLPPQQSAFLFSLSGGNLDIGNALATCVKDGLDVTSRLSAQAVFDLYLATLTSSQRLEMGTAFVADGRMGDLIARRNAETLPPGALDDACANAHAQAMARYRAGEGPLILAHALAIHERTRRLEALVEPCDILMGIGLYDTWFGFFAEIFADSELRTYGSGNDPVNGLFINAAFILYAMGYASAALPFLEMFLNKFPESRFVPTALYAQSMTYGRYQIPVDLPRAEGCAKRNLELIDTRFANHPRYMYIRVFAENAYAYIKARQGYFDDALALCENGITDIVDQYGEDAFRLHRSILIYNTSQVYELVGDWARAERRLRDAIGCDPYYAEYYNDLGNLLARLPGREHEALTAYETAILLSPPYHEAHLNRGLLRAELSDTSGAEVDFLRALEIKPLEWRALRELGNLRLVAGNAVAALEAYDAALRIEVRDADLQANAGLAASELGDRTRAIRHSRAAIALNCKHVGAHNNLAAELVALGQPNDALPHARLAAEHSDDPDFWANLATIERLCSEQNRSRDQGVAPTAH